MIFGALLQSRYFKKEFTRTWSPIVMALFFGLGTPIFIIQIIRMLNIEGFHFTPLILIVSGIIGAVVGYIRGEKNAKELYDNWDDPFYRNRKKW